MATGSRKPGHCQRCTTSSHSSKEAESSMLSRPSQSSTRKTGETQLDEKMWHGQEQRNLPMPPEMFLFHETEATLSQDVVMYFGLNDLVTICTKYKIKAIKREGKDVVVQGNFQAIDDLSSHLAKSMSDAQTLGKKLAFSPRFCATLHHERDAVLVTGEDAMIPPTKYDSEEKECEELAGISYQSRNEVSRTVGSGLKMNSENDSTEMSMETRKQTASLDFEVGRLTWTIAQLAFEKRILKVVQEHQVELEVQPKAADSRLIVVIDSSNPQDGHRALVSLTEITEQVDNELVSEELSLEVDTDINWLHMTNWKDLKTICSLKFGSNSVVVTGMAKNVRRAKSKIKEATMTQNLSQKVIGGLDSIKRFVLKSGTHLVIKAGEARSELDAAVVIVTWDKSNKKPVEVETTLANQESLQDSRKNLVHFSANASSVHSQKESREEVVNRACYQGLGQAHEMKAVVVAIQDIGSVVTLSSKDVSARCQLEAIEAFFKDNLNTSVKEIRVVALDTDTVQSFAREASSRFSPHGCNSCADSLDASQALQTGTKRTRTEGVQPGSMTSERFQDSLPGYEDVGTIEILYDIPSGNYNGNPSMAYEGLTTKAYLPSNTEGEDLLRWLRKAFYTGFTFALYPSSITKSKKLYVWWNGLSHKTRRFGGHRKNGYPDAGYLQRIRKELQEKGIE